MAKPFDKDVAKGVMNDLHRVLNYYGAFLIQGSALGAYRDGGFTPQADDIDIGLLEEDLVRHTHRIVPSLIFEGFEIRTVNQPFTKIRSIKAVKNGIKVDINGFMKWKDVRFVCNSDQTVKPYAVVYPAEMIEPKLKTSIRVFGVSWMIPNDPESYLAHEYGPDWRTPSSSNVSACRVYDYINKERIPYDILNSIET